ncbi:TetR/AcrR family transcriptional regulator [uncultured Amnibacterium sp.]|uniref:TetR/AcrR family transcriptional regulator n=1 Tax=uncultured Amnibacterium sp. TaxID=1631851 RepID=UPI0035C9826F
MAEPDVAPRRVPRGERPAKGDLRERALLDAAEALLVGGGFADASVAGLAEAVGISRAAFYFYFASKQALLASVIDRAVEHFNAEIAAVLAPERQQRPADAVRATIEAAATLWWDHGAVQVAAFELGAAVDEVYQRTMQNFAVVRDPTVALLLRVGTVPEARDVREAERLVMTLILMSERNFYDLMRGAPTPADRDSLVDRLTRIWTRAFGVAT